MDDYYNSVINTNNGGTIFTASALYGATLTLGIGETGGKYARILSINRDINQSQLYVLELKHCTFDAGGRPLKECNSRSEIATTIKENASYKIFKYTASDKWLVGMGPSRSTISYSTQKKNCVYFIANSFRPMQNLYDSSAS